MSIFDAMNISSSGLTTNRKWLDAVSDNITNMNNVSRTDEAAFQARYVVARAADYGKPAGAYVAGNVWGNPEGRVIDMPDHPLADARGQVRVPDINMGDQMAQMMMAQRAYQSNLAVVERAKATYEAAIGIGK
ncbi:flagellar basal body rod protein FlgC [Gephyromycinifex aptenodytis]|uniref:flagellar basal body rod protein FlgC n=1 Tax=Gephyromycinifex aptenodytis TaxID=2716227 RepID=UPI0014482F52|nr:flagellar basal body rod C-terminal domain-containing protein [Gephyromycinifex aptenodytis]